MIVSYARLSYIAREAAGVSLLLCRPILGGSTTDLLVAGTADAMREDNGIVSDDKFLRAVAWAWAHPVNSIFEDLPLHRQITRALLRWLQAVDHEVLRAKHDLALLLAEGVQRRLSSPDRSIRRLGMLVAESFSSFIDKVEPLRFELDENDVLDDEEMELQRIARSEEISTQLSFVNPQGNQEDDSPEADTPPAYWDSDNDSLEAYAMSEEETDDSTRLRKKVHAPSSILRLLNLIQQFNRQEEELSMEPELLLDTLRSLKKRVKERAPGAVEYAPKLVRAVIRVQAGRFPPEDETKVRMRLHFFFFSHEE